MPETHDKEGSRRRRQRDLPPVLGAPDGLPGYAELHCISNFSFQRGASHPQELVQRAYNLGYEGLAITDECSVAGVVRARMGLKRHYEYIDDLEKEFPDQLRRRDFHLLSGSEFKLEGGRLVAIARDLQSWGGLCEFITAARMSADKGEYRVGWDISDFTLLRGCEILYAPQRTAFDAQALGERLAWGRALFGDSFWLAVELPHLLDDDLWLAMLREAGDKTDVPLVAAGDVHMHKRSRKPLHDVITAVRVGKPVAACGFELQGNAERHLRRRNRLAETFPAALLANTLEVMRRCRDFDLEEIKYNYPRESLPEGLTPSEALRQLTMEGAAERYPDEIPEKVKKLLEKELALIAVCEYEMFFLTVHDIVRFA
ncbi:MAG: PHP domain-containing protein, partial [Ramlibacter sp.]